MFKEKYNKNFFFWGKIQIALSYHTYYDIIQKLKLRENLIQIQIRV